MANQSIKDALDWNRLLSLNFNEATDVVNQTIDNTIHESDDFKKVNDDLDSLSELRKDGLIAYRKAKEDKRNLIEDHRLDILNEKQAIKTKRGALTREAKRKETEVDFTIKETKRSLKSNKARVHKEAVNIQSLVKSNAIAPNAVDTPDFQAKYEAMAQGFKALANAQARLAVLAKAKAESQSALTGLGESEADKASARLLALKIQSLDRETQAWKDLLTETVNNNGADRKTKALLEIGLAERAYLVTETESLAWQKESRNERKTQIRLEGKKGLDDFEKEAKARLDAKLSSNEYEADLAKLNQAEADALAHERATAEKDKGLQSHALGLVHAYFDRERAQLANYLNGINEANDRAYKEAVADAKALKDKNAKKAVIDKAIRAYEKSESLGAYIQKRVAICQNAIVSEVTAGVHKSEDLSRYQRKVAKYYAAEAVAKNPALVDTHSMRLVIRNANEDADIAAIERRDRIAHLVGMGLVYLFLVAVAIVILFPFYWMLITSLKSNEEIRNALVPTFWPNVVAWSNYSEVFQQFDFFTYLGNTLVVGISSTALVLINCILAAFAFARLKFKGRDTLFTVFLATMMIPGEMMVITNYITVANFGWVGADATRWDAYLAMIVPFAVSVFYIYLLRQNFKQIPNELYLAARVDGKTDWQFLWKIMVPLCQPTLITIGILGLMGSWNAYVWPNLVTDNEAYRLISNGLRTSFQTTFGEPQYGYQMAATVLVTVPLLLLFIFFRKYIMRGVGRAGIKG